MAIELMASMLQIGEFVFAIATTAHFTGYIKSQLSSTDPAKLMG